MFWLFALATTAGVILATPILFQALEGQAPAIDEEEAAAGAAAQASRDASMSAFAGFALITGGLGGLLALAFDPTDFVALVVAACLGFAGGAMHPELLSALRKS